MNRHQNDPEQAADHLRSLLDDGRPHEWVRPDGLDLTAINQLVWDACADSISAPHETSALLDGSARERRERREARRAMNAVVRALPSRAINPDTRTDRRAA